MAETDIWIGTSWKMNKTLAEATVFASKLTKTECLASPRIQRFVIPPFTLVREVKQLLQKTSVKVGAQNMHWEDEGAWTGEISPVMLRDCNLDIVEIGHSERRAHFGETDRTVGLKVAAAVRHRLIPLVCVGETLAHRDAGHATKALQIQVANALKVIAESHRNAPILLAYEPVWAIGDAGIPATADYANARHAEIIDMAKHLLGRPVPCIYGGSVNLSNCEELINCTHIHGLFIGRSAWDVDEYLEILAKCTAIITRKPTA